MIMVAERVRARVAGHKRPDDVAVSGSESVVRVDNAMIVIEGAERLSWQRVTNECWVPLGVWPDANQAREVDHQLRSGAPMVVVVSQQCAQVPLLAEEFARAPGAVRAMAADPTGEVIEVNIPAFDWLPALLRSRGLRFVEQTNELLKATPRGLRPPLIVEDFDAGSNVRFVRATGSLTAVINHPQALLTRCFSAMPRPAWAS
jgi:hypothetical protein